MTERRDDITADRILVTVVIWGGFALSIGLTLMALYGLELSTVWTAAFRLFAAAGFACLGFVLPRMRRMHESYNAQLSNALSKSRVESREKGELLAFFVKYAPVAVAMFDREMNYLMCSDRWIKDSGLQGREVIGKSHYDLFPSYADYVPDRKQKLQDLLNGKDVVAEKALLPRADGGTDWFRYEAKSWRNHTGEVEGIVVFREVITARLRAAEQLEDYKSHLESIIDSMADGLLTFDESGLIETCNSTCAKIFDSKPENIIGKNVNALLPQLPVIAPEAPLQEQQSTEYTAQRLTGGAFTAAISVAHIDAGGRKYYSCIVRDTTRQHEAAQMQELLASIVSFSDDAIISKTLDSKITSWNKAAERLFGYTAEEAIGNSIYIIIPKDRAEEEKVFIRSIRDGHVLEHYETKRLRKDGSLIDVSLTLSPLRDTGGNIVGVSKVLRDITEQKRAEVELRRYSQEVEQFAYIASHDLKAPLRGIDNLAKWIMEDLGDGITPDIRKNFDLMRSRVARLETLLDDILKYSRAGKIVEEADEVDVQELIFSLTRLHPWGDNFRIECVTPMPKLYSPRTPLEQIFTNLISNAVKHHDKTEGVIGISVLDRGALCEFCVQDDGPGIPREFHDRVFALFQTLKPRDTKEGSGLGMSIVKKLVEWQGGKVWIVSDPEKRGTAVHFLWPKTVSERKQEHAA